ncbi:hypothetical protein MMC07_003263 [Pseudocyphellaria aurata]|nr:hypothetical protein [Pseudocyphellaria aurata]
MATATEGLGVSETLQQDAGPGPARQGEINEQRKGGDSQVLLPQIDLRQPAREAAANGANTEVAIPRRSNLNNSLASSLSIPFQQPRVKLPPQTSIQHDVLPTADHRDETLKKVARSPFPRGTRGRGDPRNARMKAEREKYGAVPMAPRQTHPSVVSRTQSDNIMTPPAVPPSPLVGIPRSGTSSRRSHLNRSASGVRNVNSSPGRPVNAARRPSPQGPGAPIPQQYQHTGAVARRLDDWTSWIELSVRLFGLSPNVSTRDLWKSFSKEGTIAIIELYEDNRGNRDGKGVVRFSPPPAKAFWQVDSYPITVEGIGSFPVRVELMPQRRNFMIASPVNPQLKYPELILMKADSIDFGFMYDRTTMMSMSRTVPTPQTEIQFRQNMHRRELVIEFQLNIRDPRTTRSQIPIPQLGKYNRTETIRFSIPFSQLQVIRKVKDDQNKIGLLVSMDNPPRFFRKLDEVNTHEEKSRYWTENDAWYRQTDIVYNPSHLKSSALTLKKTQPIIDIGRWTTYCFVFDMLKNDRNRFSLMSDAFRDHNVEIEDFSNFSLITKREPAVWEYIDKPISQKAKPLNALDELMAEDIVQPLVFPVRYQLEVCISQGCLNEHNMTKDFVKKLIDMDATKAQSILEHVANQKKRIYNPMEIFQLNVTMGLDSRPKIPYYCVYTRSATVTPSTVYYNTPTVETSNRVIRQYSEHADRFLRVRFTDEKFEGRINPTHKDTMNEVFTRVFRTMINGITIGDRRYEFLAFGNSQFREHGAYFIAPLPHFSAPSIRRWMGSFKEIRVIAKHAARLGQCFSTTRAISGAKVNVKEICDIERNGYCFTDGVGKISTFLAQLTASELGITQSAGGPPSVFQFRLGGCKGVLAVSPDAKGREIHIRPSQYKFPATHEGLEIIRWSQFAGASLNRQLISVLSALGVPDETFFQKLKMQLSNLEQAMTNEKLALNLLQKDIDANQMTLTVAGMILDGFQSTEEPFVKSLLQLWRAWSIKYLKEKARITVADGALLLGCIDETGSLKGHFNSASSTEGSNSPGNREESLPEIFVQLSRRHDETPFVVKGPMLLGRNPSLHPGDLRVVRGVDIPALHHLNDVVVFPQTGDRDIPSMCSGGDLDGDDFLVMWDKDLLPRDWNVEPMDYKAPKPVTLEREVTTNDITSFFVTYMKNDTLPTIAHAHLALADSSEDGVRDEKCLKLASLHSMAVDYVKTGEPAVMPRELNARKWPHFMEKKHKTKDQTYVSRKVLGRLYDQVERVDFVPAFNAPFDKRILDAYAFNEDLLQGARKLKTDYDAAMYRIMAQHEIRTEFEVWSTFVLNHAGDSKDYKFHEVIGELSNALKYQFREACYQKAGGKEFEHIGPFVAAMYHVTSEEMAQAVSECYQVRLVGGQEKPARKMVSANMPLMSFPWLFQGVLGKIANGPKNISPDTQTTANVAVQRDSKRTLPKKSWVDLVSLEEDDVLETAEGVTHRGEVLELFENLIDYEPDEPNVAPEVQSNPTSGSVGLAASLSVDEMLFDDSLRGSVAQGKTGLKKSKIGSDCLMDAPLEGLLSYTRSENDGMPDGYRAPSSDPAIHPSSGDSRPKLPDNRWRLVEEFAQSVKQDSQRNGALQESLGADLSTDLSLVHFSDVSATAKKDSSSPNNSDSLQVISKGDSEVDTTEEGSLQFFEAASHNEMEDDEAGSDYESVEEAIDLDTSASLVDRLMKLNAD